MSAPLGVDDREMPGLYQAANEASIQAQRAYYRALLAYLVMLVLAAAAAFGWPDSTVGAAISAGLFLLSLGILVWMRVQRPDDTWYDARAVAESVKTRSWRWMMRAGPYEDTEDLAIMRKRFLGDLKAILDLNRGLGAELGRIGDIQDAITPKMIAIRALSVDERRDVYLRDRIRDQATWYLAKSKFNKRRAGLWFGVSVGVHLAAIILLVVRITGTTLRLPVEVIATLAGAVLTWLKAKKHNELSSSYALAAQEIVLIKSEGDSVASESRLAEFVVNAETAFSREHTLWVARKTGH